MKITSLLSSSKRYSRLLPVMVLSLYTLTACQKEPETTVDNQTESVTQDATVVTDDVDTVKETVSDGADDTATESEREIDLAELENNIGADGVTPNSDVTTPSPEQTIKGTQVTDVKYRNAAGDTLSVVFETSATGVLNAIVTLPNQPTMTLSAPEGQGNNPTYRSKDGSIELISHGGGSSIDLMKNDKIISFEAISADAEVVTQP